MNEEILQTYKPLFARKYLWLFSGRIMPLLSLFLITIIYSRKLDYDNYGTFQSVWIYANIVNIIISFGFSSVILSTNLSFLFLFIKTNRKIIIIFYTILSLAGFTAFFFLSKNFDTTLKFLLIVFMIVQNMITVAETLLIKRGKEKVSFVINLFYSLLFFGCHVYILFSNYSLPNLIAALCIISILKLVLIQLVPAQNNVYEPVTGESHFLKHWGYLGFTELLGVTSKWIDKIFLLYLLTAKDFAIFFNGAVEIPLFGLLISVAGSSMLIEFPGNLQLKGKIISLFKESFTMLSSIAFPLFFFLFFFREEIFAFVFKDKYNDSVPVFAISILILPLRINNYSVILQFFSQGKKIMIGSLMDIIIAVSLMVILYPVLGTRGIVLAIVISTYCQVLYYLWHSAKSLQIKMYELLPLQKLIVKFLILLAVYFIIFLCVRNSSIPVKLLVGTIGTFLLTAAGLWSYLINFFKKEL